MYIIICACLFNEVNYYMGVFGSIGTNFRICMLLAFALDRVLARVGFGADDTMGICHPGFQLWVRKWTQTRAGT